VELANGGKEWWKEDKRHRTDGPAVVTSVGAEYWVEGVRQPDPL